MKKYQSDIVRQRFFLLSKKFIDQGANLTDLRNISVTKKQQKQSFFRRIFRRKKVLLSVLFPLFLIKSFEIDTALHRVFKARCLLTNNYLIWEFTRPVSNCNFCRNIDSALILQNMSKEEFREFAYSSKPIIVKKAAAHWPASKIFSLNFFRHLYDGIPGAYESIEEECQFLHFHSNFENLKQVLRMNKRRALNLEGEKSWYVGWKNCHPQVLEVMSKFYQPPHFLPEDAEIPPTNYVFLGYNQGANMHLDYIPRLMWQGQLIGSKTWTVAPTPECDNVCKRFSFFVDTSDIVLLDTRIWYHSTRVENGQFSLTITSEYG